MLRSGCNHCITWLRPVHVGIELGNAPLVRALIGGGGEPRRCLERCAHKRLLHDDCCGSRRIGVGVSLASGLTAV
eukprot:6010998-Prymnesium_polylepis.1